MALLPAWAVDGGKVPAAMARRESYRASQGATGVTLPTDLRVRELATPGTSVRIGSGSGVMVSRYPSAVNESYGIANDSDAELAIPATGSGSGATRYVIARVSDPQHGGQEPDDPLTAPYCTFEQVSSIENLNYPFLPLAKINQPASTATITQSMIKDLRQVALPRTRRYLRTVALTEDSEVDDILSSETGENWPDLADTAWGALDIPEWATRFRVVMTWAGVLCPPGNASGQVWVQLGEDSDSHKVSTEKVFYNTPGSSQTARMTMVSASDEEVVPVAFRGTAQKVYPTGKHKTGPNSARIRLDAGAASVLDIEFFEAATEDD